MKYLALMFFVFVLSCSKSVSDEPSAPHNSAEWQVWAYSTAAPSYIGDYATVMGGDGSILREGSNGWTCMPGNPRPFPANGWDNPHQAMPTCSDTEAMKWMAAFMNNVDPIMDRDGYMWMLHGDVGEANLVPGVLSKSDSTPGQFIESGPHFMVVPKDPETLKNFTADFTRGEPYVMFPDSKWAHLMVPVGDYYKYQPESSPSN